MSFASVYFVFLFLPIVLFLYYIAKIEYRNYVLLIASIIFYAYGEPGFVFVMLGSIVVNWLSALVIDSLSGAIARRIVLVVNIIVNLTVLYIYKYLDFSFSVIYKLFGVSIPYRYIVLPIGISFFTFQAMSYVIDVYRCQEKAHKNPLHVALYIAFFPQLVAGPIVRYYTISRQILNRESTLEKFGDSAKRFITGFSKKVILANNLSMIAEPVFLTKDYTGMSELYIWLGAIAYALQIYYDFSGYSDMAIGLAGMFGFDLEENFNYPYISASITEFWRRWHISLSSWFRDYVYIPLGGSRCKRSRHIINLLIVWLLTGIWHGAHYTFIVWGLVYFVFLVIEKYIIKPEGKAIWFKLLWRIITLLIIILNWTIFNSASLHNAVMMIGAMFGRNTAVYISDDIVKVIREYGVFIVAAIVFSTPIAKVISKKFYDNKLLINLRTIIVPAGYCTMFLWAVSFLILGAHNPFIYFNF